jgi:enoyl-CoA hydratase/carnithine racemase
MLGRVLTARQLADLGVINHAVPATALDATVDEIVSELLMRSPRMLALTKRLLNRRALTQLEADLDLSIAYQHIGNLEALENWQPESSIEPPVSRRGRGKR